MSKPLTCPQCGNQEKASVLAEFPDGGVRFRCSACQHEWGDKFPRKISEAAMEAHRARMKVYAKDLSVTSLIKGSPESKALLAQIRDNHVSYDQLIELVKDES